MDAGVQDTATTGAQVVNDSLLDRNTGVWDTESTGVPVVDYSTGAQRKSPPESTENTDHPGFGPTTSPHTAHSPPLTVDNDRTARTVPVCQHPAPPGSPTHFNCDGTHTRPGFPTSWLPNF